MQYRQGDVLVEEVNGTVDLKDAKDVTENGKIILAHGEVTGHAHEVVTEDPAKFVELNGKRYMVLSGAATLKHQEHGAIALKPGTYTVTRQREWTDQDEQLVRD